MSQKIFITGATGFIGSHVVLQTLEAGFDVRLSVRKQSQISALKTLFSGYDSKVEFTIIPDLAAYGAFHNALKGVAYVFHIASPMPGTGSDFKKDYVEPAEQGTLAILKAATSEKTIKKVVIVSSLLALVPLDALVTKDFHAKGKVSYHSCFHFTDFPDIFQRERI